MCLITQNLLNTLQISLLNADQCSVSNWNHNNVISPFTRMYLVNGGEGKISHGNKEYDLKPGNIYIIPGYTYCDYSTNSFLDHYYIHLIPELAGGLNIYNIMDFKYEISATDRDLQLFKRIIQLNPGIKLREINPRKYTQDSLIQKAMVLNSAKEITSHIETMGILLQLFSRFFKSVKEVQETENLQHKGKIIKAINYINENLHKNILIKELSDMCCCSNDYFSRIFLKIMGTRPIDYINLKKIETAQLLLITSDDPIEKISLEIGVDNYPYFNRLFKKYSRCTPGEYRKLHQAV